MTENTRITIMTYDEAWRAYNKFLDADQETLRWYYPTFAGWLQHKGIVIKPEEKR